MALRRKNGALSVQAKSVSIDGDFIQAKAYKASFFFCGFQLSSILEMEIMQIL